jgi:hypothetical protein
MGGGKRGGGGKAKDYFGSIAGLVCAGPVDELVSIIVDKKTVWEGPMSRTGVGITNPQSIAVAGYGTVIFYWGTDDQVVNTTLTPELAHHPPYRRQAWVVLKDFLFGRERTSAPNVEFVVRRKARQATLTGPAADLDADHQANPLAALAELVTDPVFGLGQPQSLLDAPSWQTTADALTAQSARTHLSAVLDQGTAFRSAVAGILVYFDGWLRWNSDGAVEAGRFIHNEAAPAFDATTTIDVHDLVEEVEFDAEGWADTVNEVLVRFRDRERAFKDAGARAVSAWNREVVGEPRQARIERPFITRPQQAADHAAELVRMASETSLSGTLDVRAEKAVAILPGDVFLLNHDPVQLSIVCRCLEKTHPASDAGRVLLRFAAERGIAPAPHQATVQGLGEPQEVEAEEVSLQQIVQVPPVLAGGDTTVRIAVLAARTDPLSLGLYVHLQQEDGSGLFYQLGGQTGWAITGTLQQAYSADAPAAGTVPPDDDGESLRLTLDPATNAQDLTKVSTTQTADSISDAAVLVWVFKASDPSQFEVMALKGIRIIDGEPFYRLKVRRARFGTRQLAFAADDRAFILLGEDLVTYSHARFPAYAAAAATATFRLQSFNAWGEADVSDTDVCPDIPYTFDDPYAPDAVWLSVKRNWVEITDFDDDFALTDDFSLTAQATDAGSDLVGLTLIARLGTDSRTLLAVTTGPTGTLTRSVAFRPSSSAMTEGDWRLYVVADDSTGRRREVQMTPGGGGSPVMLRLRTNPGADTAAIAPVATPPGGAVAAFPVAVTLASSTPGATIEYELRELGQAPTGTWTTYSSPVSVTGQKSLYARATAMGLSDSPTVQEDYAQAVDETPPGWNIV